MRPSSSRRSRQSGSVMVLMCLISPFLLIPLVGLAIDASIARLVQLRLQAAVDGAALGAGRLLGTTALPDTVASEFLAANFRTDGSVGTWGAYGLSCVPGTDIVYTPGITQRIDITARANVPLLFMRIFHFTSVLVAAKSSATRSDSRVVFVLDRSGSMGPPPTGSNVIVAAKADAAGFVSKFTSGRDELGLVVFDGSAVVGFPTYAAGGYATDISLTTTGGPSKNFISTVDSTLDMPTQIAAVQASNGTGMAEAISLAYVEIQKAHMRDLQSDGVDTRGNAIVLLTDGMPTALSMYLNDPHLNANGHANNIVTAGSGCNNAIISPPTGSQVWGDVENTNTMMKGWLAIPGNAPFTTNAFSAGNGYPEGVERLANKDITQGSTYWMGLDPGTGIAPDVADPPHTPYAGCTGTLLNYNSGGANTGANALNRLSKIPEFDMWSNSTQGNMYQTASSIVGNGSATSVYQAAGGVVNLTKQTVPYHWALAMWNAVDSAAQRARTDVNKATRTLAGDTTVNPLRVTFYVVGYSGNGGVDDGLLMRVANDSNAVGYDGTQPQGKYYRAANTADMAAALDKIASELLRLAK